MSSIHQRLQKLEGDQNDLGIPLPVEEAWFELIRKPASQSAPRREPIRVR